MLTSCPGVAVACAKALPENASAASAALANKDFLMLALPFHAPCAICTRFGASTDRMSSAPITLVWVLPVMLAKPMPLRRLRMTRIERPTPIRLPEPPKMLTPPRRTMVMMSSSKPCAMSPRTDPSRAA